MLTWYQRNRESELAKAKARHSTPEGKVKRAAAQRAYYARHREVMRLRAKDRMASPKYQAWRSTWYAKAKTKQNEAGRRRYANPEWREKHRARGRTWNKLNRDKLNARDAARKAAELRATPPWADQETIRDFYLEAAYQGLEVDHTVPLKSDLVCGLHCESNMQLLSKSENSSKQNRFWPDMP